MNKRIELATIIINYIMLMFLILEKSSISFELLVSLEIPFS